MQFVFSTTKTTHYRFPTHTNDLVMDRAEATTSEVFVVVLEPGEAPPMHKHDDTEQIFYVLEGQGTLTIGKEKQQHRVNVGDVVRIPPSMLHSIEAEGDKALRYLAVDCFTEGRPKDEPTWESHVRVMCKNEGWDYSQIGRSAVK